MTQEPVLFGYPNRTQWMRKLLSIWLLLTSEVVSHDVASIRTAIDMAV